MMDEQPAGNLVDGITFLAEVNGLLGRDTLHCLQRCVEIGSKLDPAIDVESDEDYQFWIRTLIRTFFAHVEGLTYAMRQLAIAANESGVLALAAEEVLLLRELEYRVDVDRKEIRSRPKQNRVLENVFLAFHCFPRVFGVSFAPEYGNNGWNLFQRSLKLRHSLTHPKDREALAVGRQVAIEVTDSFQWFGNQVQNLLSACRAASLGGASP